MATDISTAAPASEVRKAGRRRLPPELSILAVMIGMMLLFEVLGWMFVGQSFIANPLRLRIMILQEAEIGIIAVGVTQVIIMGGIDVGAKAEIHKLITELAVQGVAVLMISSELPEVLGMSDRILVMHEGRMTGIVDRKDATQVQIMELASQ